MGELAALQSQNSDSNEQIQDLIRQLKLALHDTLTLNRWTSIAMWKSSRGEDANPSNWKSPNETKKPAR